MNDNKKEIDLLEVMRTLLQRIGLIILAAVLVGALVLGYTVFFVTPTYTASAMMYVNNSSFSVGSTSFSFSASELSAAQSLIDTYAVIAKSRSTLGQVIEDLQLDYTYGQLYGMVDVEAVDSTEVFRISITDESPEEAEMIANKLAEILPDSIGSVVDGSDVRLVDYAVVPAKRTSPSYTNNTAIGMLIGAVLAAVFVLVQHYTDDIIRTEDYLSLNYPAIPLLAAIPDMKQVSSGGYGYGYGYYAGSSHRKRRSAPEEFPEDGDEENV